MSLRQIDCPKCNGTGKLNTDSHQAGRKQHNLIWNTGKRGPWGWIIAICARCGRERTRSKKLTLYRWPGEEWQAGFDGCYKRDAHVEEQSEPIQPTSGEGSQ